ncbi:glycoside hydrolase superfamily [Aspergillus lucknowensis]|uniref:Glycoside hydrolase superfamily n=1 Tax=Aspergillus lucknowensis TaxID=176173 RepID=A0ABR4LXW0_9EURO
MKLNGPGLLSLALSAELIAVAAAEAATVDASTTTGKAQFLGSNFIYGFPDNGVDAQTAIPDHFLTDIKFNACRAGGAQLPYGGWASGGYDEYIGRFESTLSNYRSTRKYGGDFILLVHDLWGADGGSSADALFPGDNGDFGEFDAFLDQLKKDVEDNDMLEGLILDLWNEPELDIFWNRPWEQYLDYYLHATEAVRESFPNTSISGPSFAHSPSLTNSNWTTWLEAVSSNDAVPDRYSWHQIGSWEREPDTTIPDLHTLLDTYGLPQLPIDVNEYAWTTEQNPANSVYYLAQLERHDLRGLRANWGSGEGLHDFLANLVFKTEDGSEYRPNGEWHVYNYYANMTGDRLATTASPDLQFDVFATSSADGVVKILAGTRTVLGSYDIAVSGLPGDGSAWVRTYRFDWDGPAAEVESPVDLGCEEYQISSGQITLTVEPPTDSTAFAFEISKSQGC